MKFTVSERSQGGHLTYLPHTTSIHLHFLILFSFGPPEFSLYILYMYMHPPNAEQEISWYNIFGISMGEGDILDHTVG